MLTVDDITLFRICYSKQAQNRMRRILESKAGWHSKCFGIIGRDTFPITTFSAVGEYNKVLRMVFYPLLDNISFGISAPLDIGSKMFADEDRSFFDLGALSNCGGSYKALIT